MGCEAHLTLSRVVSGDWVLEDAPEDAPPRFVVREPVCILPARFLRVGPWTNIEVPGILTAMVDDDIAMLVIVPDCIGLIVVPRPTLLSDPRLREEWEAVLAWEARRGDWREPRGIPLGGEPLTGLIQTWDRITPGRWIVRRYSVSGGGPDAPFFSAAIPPGVALGESVEWEVWT